MEDELRCCQCRSFYHVPVLLSCRHSLCLSCANSLQKSCSGSSANGVDEGHPLPPCFGDDPHETSEVDKVSLLSDTDSGVSCSSRPTSQVSATDSANILNHCDNNSASSSSSSSCSVPFYTIKCPLCDRETPLSERGSDGLQRYRVLGAVVDKYLERFQVAEPCQLCDKNCTEDGVPRPAHFFCDQCFIFYCSSCRETCHPSRGPLAGHWLVSVSEGRALLRARRREREGKCTYHPSESVSMYCLTCRSPVCVICLHHGRHHAHDVHALNAITKSLKTGLSQSLQQLSEKAKGATEFIHTLKSLQEEVQGSCREVEGVIVAQIDALQDALQERRTSLINWLRLQRDQKIHSLKDQAQEYTHTLQSTTGTIHFCIEALKEADPTAFMEAQEVLEEKITALVDSWRTSMNPEPRTSPSFDLSLDDKSLLASIQQLTFIQLKPPGPPSFALADCSAENNSVTVCWTSHACSATSGYLLEIDDGASGHFKEVYSGRETVCTIDGLHFNSIYRVRVRGFNGTGISQYSERLCLQTAEVAWFSMSADHSDIVEDEDGKIISCDSFEHRIVLGTVGFSRGDHYWKFEVIRYDGNADVAFGVARRNIDKEQILGMCTESWSMYIDCERSWLVHAGEHSKRSKGGIHTGDTIGVILSWDEEALYFFVNDSFQGSIPLNGVCGVLVPAISLNRSVALQLHTSLNLPDYFCSIKGLKHLTSTLERNSL